MKLFLDPFLREALRDNDPAPVGLKRMGALLSNILCNVEETPQLAPRHAKRPSRFLSLFSERLASPSALALAALLLGLWVGQEVPLQSGVSVETEMKAPVLAMADPWQSFVAVEEE